MSDIPQFILLTVDDSVQDYDGTDNWNNKLRKLAYHNATDATGCRPRLTLFLEDDQTNYALVQQVAVRGGEIAQHTIDHLPALTNLSDTADGIETWRREVEGNKNVTASLVPVPRESIVGGRAPWLQYNQANFDVLKKFGSLYDFSMVAQSDDSMSKMDYQKKTGQWIWPYTFDNGTPQPCQLLNQSLCPRFQEFKGLWEFPIVTLVDFENDPHTNYEIDPDPDNQDYVSLLNSNFDAHYHGNRAPLSLSIHGSWFDAEGDTGPQRVKAVEQWFTYAATHKNTVFATPRQVIEWLKNPVPVSALRTHPSFKCPQPPNRSSRATSTHRCDGWNPSAKPFECVYAEGHLETCVGCPQNYPTTNFSSISIPRCGDGTCESNTNCTSCLPEGCYFCESDCGKCGSSFEVQMNVSGVYASGASLAVSGHAVKDIIGWWWFELTLPKGVSLGTVPDNWKQKGQTVRIESPTWTSNSTVIKSGDDTPVQNAQLAKPANCTLMVRKNALECA
jgi:hypothetical protein